MGHDMMHTEGSLPLQTNLVPKMGLADCCRPPVACIYGQRPMATIATDRQHCTASQHANWHGCQEALRMLQAPRPCQIAATLGRKPARATDQTSRTCHHQQCAHSCVETPLDVRVQPVAYHEHACWRHAVCPRHLFNQEGRRLASKDRLHLHRRCAQARQVKWFLEVVERRFSAMTRGPVQQR